MIHRIGVHCGNTYPQELEINVDTVYKRYNIHKYKKDEEIGYEYDEDELTLVEYFRQTVPDNQSLTDEALAELSIIITEYQEQVDAALGELSTLIGELSNNNV